MSTSVDERVVRMKFDNSQFQKATQDTTDSLDKLKEKLSFKGAGKGLEDVASASDKCTGGVGKIGSAVDEINGKFSAMGIAAATVISNLTTKVTDFATHLAKEFTVQPIIDGFHEYETQMGAIQTIMSNTNDAFADKTQQEHLDAVNDALNEMNTYADKTIYNFTEMSKNLGTFTAAGLDLETSKNAIEGIANLAAVSGSNSEQASRAMYQLSQALASGTVNLQDWNSVVNAGMGGQVFQKALERTAKNMGTLSDEEAEMLKNGQETFRDSISGKNKSGWLNGDVLAETLNELSGAYSKADLMGKGYSESQAKEIMALADDAMKAATKVKTFSQLIDTVKEAIGSGWTQTWQYIIGDFGEAKKLWSGISDYLGDVINKTAGVRNEMLKTWHDDGGRTALLKGLYNIFKNLETIINAVAKAFRTVFPPTTGEQLISITQGFEKFTESMRIGKGTADGITSVFTVLFRVLKVGVDILKGILACVGPILEIVGTLLSTLFKLLTPIDDIVSAGLKMIETGLQSINIYGALSKVVDVLATVFGALEKAISSIVNWFSKLIPKTKEHAKATEDSNKATTETKNIFEILGSVISKVTDAIGKVFEKLGSFNNVLAKIGYVATSIFDWLFKQFSKFLSIIGGSDATKAIDNLFLVLAAGKVGKISDAVSGLFDSVKDLFGGLKDIVSSAGEIVGAIKKVFGGLTDTLEELQTSIKANTLIKIAVAVGVLAGAVISLGKQDASTLAQGLKAMTAITAVLVAAFAVVKLIINKLPGVKKVMTFKDMFIQGIGGIFTSIQKVIKSYKKSRVKEFGQAAVLFAGAVAILTSSMYAISKLSVGDIVKGVITIAALGGELILFIKILDKFNAKVSMKTSIALIAFSKAVERLSVSMQGLAKLSWNEIAKGLVAIAGLLASITISSKFIKGKGMITASIGITIMAKALQMLEEPMKVFGALSWNGIAKGLATVAGVLTAVTIVSKKVKSGKLLIMSVSLIALAKAFQMLEEPLAKLATISWEGIVKGLVMVSDILFSVALASNMVKSGKLIGFSACMILMAKAFEMLQEPLGSLSQMSWDGIAKGLITIAGVLASVIATTKLIGKDTTKLFVIAKALVAVALAFKILEKPIQEFGAMDIGSLAKGLGGTAAVLLSLTLALKALSSVKISLGMSLAITSLTLSLGMLTEVIKQFANIDVGTIVKSLVTFAAALALFGGASILLSGCIGPMLALAGAMAVLGAAVLALGVGTTALATGLFALGPALTTFFGSLVTNQQTIINGIGLAVTAFITSFRVIMASILQTIIELAPLISEAITSVLNAALDAITAVIPKIVAVLGTIIDGLTVLIPKVVNLVMTFIEAVVAALDEYGPTIISHILSFIDGVIQAITDYLPTLVADFANLVLTLIQSISAAIVQYGPQILDAVNQMVAAIIYTILSGLQDIVSHIPVIGGTLSGFLQDGKDSISKAYNFDDLKAIGQKGADGAVSGVKSKKSDMDSAGNELGKSGDSGLESGLGSMSDTGTKGGKDAASGLEGAYSFVEKAGKYIGDGGVSGTASADYGKAGVDSGNGYASGLSSTIDKVKNAAATLATNGLDKIKSILGIHSPSREYKKIGMYSDLGFANGLLTYAKVSDSASEKVGQSALDNIASAMSNVNDSFSGIDGYSPTITPVVDMTNIQNSAALMQHMFDGFVYKINGVAGSVTSKDQMVTSIINQEMRRVTKRINQRLDALDDGDKTYTFVTNTQLDGRQIARSTATYTQDELNRLNRLNQRMEGYV